MSGLQIILSLTRNFADIAFFIILINRLHPHAMKLQKRLQDVILGILFGLSGIISMQISAAVSEGVTLDMKNMVVAMAGVFGGYRAGVLAAVIAGGYRYLLGGAGWEPAVWMIMLCAALGILCKRLEDQAKLPSNVTTHLLFGAMIALITLAGSLTLPWSVTLTILTYNTLPLLIILPLASAAFRYFIIQWHKPTSQNPELSFNRWNVRAAAERLQNLMDNSGTAAVCLIHITDIQHTYPFNDDLMKGAYNRVCALLPRGFVTRIREDEILCCLTAFQDSGHLFAEASYIQRKLSEPVMIRNRAIHITAHIGVAVHAGHESAEMLIQQADSALRHAKEQGQTPVTLYQEKLQLQQIYRSKLEEGLRQALDNDQLELHYQPQFHIQSGRVRGFEALLRWRHPELGPVSPGEFIPVAEENGTILPIGLWALRRACEHHCSVLINPFPESVICVNISAVQLNDCNFPAYVSQILNETGMPPQLLELEITESMLIASIDSANARLQELDRLGVRIALDDFGTGYSSLHYLNRLPLHLVKLDKSFIRDICKNNAGRLTQSIIRLLQDLNIRVVAEGVESYDQLHRLKLWNCDVVQGYLLGKPLPEHEIAGFIAKQKPVTEAVLTRA